MLNLCVRYRIAPIEGRLECLGAFSVPHGEETTFLLLGKQVVALGMHVLWVWMLERPNGSRLFWHVNPTQMDEHLALSGVKQMDLVRHHIS